MPDPGVFDGLFPPIETPTPATTADPSAATPPAGEAAPEFGRASTSRAPLLAGLGVTLAILIFGGGFLWWRNRDSQYWPA